jgi:phage-related holin
MDNTNLAERFTTHLNVRYPEIVGTLAAVFAPAITFFSVPVLLGLMAMLMLDFLTGIVKAQQLGLISSARFGVIFERCVLYVLMYIVLHVLTLSTPAPWDFFTKLFEGFVMTGLLFKESLSVLENIKGTLTVRGRSVPILDLAITKLGLDLDHILRDFAKLRPPEASTQQPPAAAPVEPVAAAPVEPVVFGPSIPEGLLQPSPAAVPTLDPKAPPAGPDAPQAG